ncbi:CaiB/BaiF CoA transferase family protein [Chloroflexota bacterium]
MAMILEGIRVVDCTVMVAGPGAASMLADLGADVIHVEQPGVGDMLRGLEKVYGIPMELPGNRHLLFEDLNRNKRSITLDLRKNEGREILYRLVQKSDVVMTNMRPKAVGELGLCYEDLKQHNPKLVYASATAFGPKGPEHNAPALDLTGIARSGAMWMMGHTSTGPADLFGLYDRVFAIMMAYGVIAALLARERLGIGQEVTVSGLSSMMSLTSMILQCFLLGRELPRPDRTKATNPLYNYYKCKDGSWLCLGFLWEKEWEPFCKATGMLELMDNPKFKDANARAENHEELISILDNMVATKTFTEWEEILKQMGAPNISHVNRLSDLLSDPQVLANEYIVQWDHPILGDTKWVSYPAQFRDTPASLRTPAPECGQHTEEVLLEICGYTWDDIVAFRDQKVI